MVQEKLELTLMRHPSPCDKSHFDETTSISLSRSHRWRVKFDLMLMSDATCLSENRVDNDARAHRVGDKSP